MAPIAPYSGGSSSAGVRAALSQQERDFHKPQDSRRRDRLRSSHRIGIEQQGDRATSGSATANADGFAALMSKGLAKSTLPAAETIPGSDGCVCFSGEQVAAGNSAANRAGTATTAAASGRREPNSAGQRPLEAWPYGDRGGKVGGSHLAIAEQRATAVRSRQHCQREENGSCQTGWKCGGL